MYPFDIEVAERNLVSRFNRMKRGRQAVLLELVFKQRECKVSSIDRHVHFLQEERHGSDVVLVAVSKNNRGNLIAIVFDEREVGYDDVDSGRVFLGEAHA